MFNDNESSSSGSISTAAVQAIVDKLKWEQHRSSTKRAYYSVWKTFNQFYVQLDVRPKIWEDRLTLFVAYLINKNRKSGTIKSYVSAIRAVLMEIGEKLNEDRTLLCVLTKACHLQNVQVHTRLPIRKPLLTCMLRKIPLVFQAPQPYLVTLYKAILSTAYFGLFRVGELTYSEYSDHIVKVKDVHIGMNKDKILFVLHTSKMHGRGVKPQQVKIKAARKTHTSSKVINHVCPFQLIRDYLAVR